VTTEYVTEIWCPPADNGVQALHSHMREPEPHPVIHIGEYDANYFSAEQIATLAANVSAGLAELAADAEAEAEPELEAEL
jgi:hypothetical protein